MASEKVGEVYIEVETRVDKSEPQRTIRSIKNKVAKEGDAKLGVSLTGERHVQSSISRLVQAIRRTRSNIEVSADTSQASRRIKSISESARNNPALVKVRAETAKAAAELSALARTRHAVIEVSVKPNIVQDAFSSALGGSLLAEVNERVGHLARNIDTSALSWGKHVTQIGSVATALTSLTGLATTVGNDMSKALGAGLAAPGIWTGFTMGMLGSFDGLQNILPRMREVTSSFGRMRELGEPGGRVDDGYDIFDELKRARLEGGHNFWRVAQDQLRDLRDNFFIPFFEEYRGMMTNLGGWWREFFAGISSGLQSVGGMSALFEPLNESIKIATGGAAALIDGLIQLGWVGGQYLPRMAEGFVVLANQFRDWVSAGIESGAIFKIIDEGIDTIKTIAGIVVVATGIFKTLGFIAAEAGFGGLTTVLDVLKAIYKEVSGGEFRNALLQVFSGALEGVQNALPAVDVFRDTFIKLAPTISDAMGDMGRIVSNIAKGIGKALTDPMFVEGFSKLIDAVVAFTAELEPSFQMIGEKLGSFASLFATVLEGLAPVINSVLTNLVPPMTELLAALEPVVEIISQGLADALQVILPIVGAAISKIAEFAQAHPELTAVIVSVVGSLGLFIAGAMKISGALSPVIGAIGKVVTALGGWSAIWGGVIAVVKNVVGWVARFALGFVSLPVLIGAAVVALVALIVLNWDKISAWTQETWQKVIDFSSELWGRVTQVIGDAVNAVVTWIQEAWGNVGSWLSETWGAILSTATEWITGVYETIKLWIDNLILMWQGAWDGLLTKLTEIFTAITEFFAPVFEGIYTIFTAFKDFLAQIWQATWDGLTLVVTTVGGLIWEAVSGLFEILYTIFDEAVKNIQGLWSLAWGALVEYLTPILTTLWTTVSDWFNAIWDTISGVLTAIGVTVQTIWDTVYSTIAGVLQSIWDAVSGYFTSVYNTVSATLSSVWATVKGIFDAIYDKVSGVVSSVYSTVASSFRDVYNAVADAISGVYQKVSEIFDRVLNYLSGLGQRIWYTTSSAFGRMRGAVVEVLNKVMEVIWGLPGRIRNALGNLGNLLVGSGRALMWGFLDGISSMVSRIRNKVSSIVQSIRDFFPFSPAKVGAFSGRGYTTYSGKALMDDFGDALKDNAGSQVSKMQGAMSKIQDSMGLTLSPQVSSVSAPASASLTDAQSAQAAMTRSVLSVKSDTDKTYTQGDIDRIVNAIAGFQPIVKIGEREFTGLVRQAERNFA